EPPMALPLLPHFSRGPFARLPRWSARQASRKVWSPIMPKSIVVAVTLFALTWSSSGALARQVSVLASAPSDFTCAFVTVTTANDAVQCSWTALEGATKYSVDVVANFDVGNGTTMSADFDFGTSGTSVTIPLSSFPTDVNGDLAADVLQSLVLR